MIHYHGTPIAPIEAFYEMCGRHFCVTHGGHAHRDNTLRCHQIGQSVMLDNGAYSKWRLKLTANWPEFYDWAEPWLSFPTTWAVIPDVIDAGPEAQDALLAQWPFGPKGSPVWHMDEPVERLLRLCDAYPRVCIGSTAKFDPPLSPAWKRRMDEVWTAIAKRHRFLPWVHMLRGMQCSGRFWPFASVDSTDIARNHNRPQNSPGKMAARWDGMQCPGTWAEHAEQLNLLERD